MLFKVYYTWFRVWNRQVVVQAGGGKGPADHSASCAEEGAQAEGWQWRAAGAEGLGVALLDAPGTRPGTGLNLRLCSLLTSDNSSSLACTARSMRCTSAYRQTTASRVGAATDALTVFVMLSVDFVSCSCGCGIL